MIRAQSIKQRDRTSILDFGAKRNDPDFDNAPVINAAIAALIAVGGGELFFPVGDYYHSGDIADDGSINSFAGIVFIGAAKALVTPHRLRTYLGDGVTTTFELAEAPLLPTDVRVTLDDEILELNVDYTISGSNVVFTVAPGVPPPRMGSAVKNIELAVFSPGFSSGGVRLICTSSSADHLVLSRSNYIFHDLLFCCRPCPTAGTALTFQPADSLILDTVQCSNVWNGVRFNSTQVILSYYLKVDPAIGEFGIRFAGVPEVGRPQVHGIFFNTFLQLHTINYFSATADCVQFGVRCNSNLFFDLRASRGRNGIVLGDEETQFTGIVNDGFLDVTSIVSGGPLVTTMRIPFPPNRVYILGAQVSGTPGGVGTYILNRSEGDTEPEQALEAWPHPNIGLFYQSVSETCKFAGTLMRYTGSMRFHSYISSKSTNAILLEPINSILETRDVLFQASRFNTCEEEAMLLDRPVGFIIDSCAIVNNSVAGDNLFDGIRITGTAATISIANSFIGPKVDDEEETDTFQRYGISIANTVVTQAIRIVGNDLTNNATGPLLNEGTPSASNEIVGNAGLPSVLGAALTVSGATAIPAGGANTVGLKATATANFGIFFGSGVPTLSAAKGSLYLRSDGSTTNDRAYVNTDGATTWTAVTTAA